MQLLSSERFEKSMCGVVDCIKMSIKFKHPTKTDSADMCLIFSDVDASDKVDHEINDVLPVVDAWRIQIPYAAGTVDYYCYVYPTCCNMYYHTTPMQYLYLHSDHTTAEDMKQFPLVKGSGNFLWAMANSWLLHTDHYSLSMITKKWVLTGHTPLRLGCWLGISVRDGRNPATHVVFDHQVHICDGNKVVFGGRIF